jgi:hypothetical protein
MRPAALVMIAVAAAPGQTYERDIRPLLEANCVACHRRGGIGPMPLETYEQARPWAKAIREAVLRRKMPPWFAEAGLPMRNEPGLTAEGRDSISRWALAGAPRGEAAAAVVGRRWPAGWRIEPDLILRMPEPVKVRRDSVLDYQFAVLPDLFIEDRWVRAVEVRPGDAAVVHHAVVYVRTPEMTWLRNGDTTRRTTADILAVYAPGSNVVELPEGYAKKIPAGSDLILQLHYTAGKKDTEDRTSVGLRFGPAPRKRVHTLQMSREDFTIGPGEPDARFSVSGTLPAEVELLSLFPHLHLRGKAFEFLAGNRLLLRVKPYDFHWQLTYWLREPLRLAKGTRLVWTAWYDNSAANPRNPDPTAAVRVGEQSWEEMLVGFFDVAVDPELEKEELFRLR